MLEGDERVLKDQDVEIYVAEHADSAVILLTRAWVNSGDYWGLYFDMLENVKLTFDKEGISIPFPQMDVHLHKQDGEQSLA